MTEQEKQFKLVEDDLRALSQEDWRIQIKAEDAEAIIVTPDTERRGWWIGPLVDMPMGSQETVSPEFDGDEEYETTLTEGSEGRNLYAVAALPQFARLVVWALDKLGELNGIHFDSTNDSGRFHRELYNRCRYLAELIGNRQRTLDDTEPNSAHTLMTFEQVYDKQSQRIQ